MHYHKDDGICYCVYDYIMSDSYVDLKKLSPLVILKKQAAML